MIRTPANRQLKPKLYDREETMQRKGRGGASQQLGNMNSTDRNPSKLECNLMQPPQSKADENQDTNHPTHGIVPTTYQPFRISIRTKRPPLPPPLCPFV